MKNDSNQLSAAEKRKLLIKLLQQREAKKQDRYLPSYGQSLLWFVQQMHPESAEFNESFAWRLKATLSDEQGLEIATIMLQRHSILRTTYQLVDGKLQAVVHSSLPIDFAAIDAHDWDDDQLRAAMQEHANLLIDLERGPIIRLRLFRCKQELTWLTTIHHIAIDLASMVTLMEDVKLILVCKLTGQSIPAWSYPSYDQFAAWQREFVESAAGILQRDFWLKQLNGVESLKLPTDFPPKLTQLAPSSSENLRLRRSLTTALIRLAKSQNTTLYSVLLTAFQILMGRYCGQDKFLLGSVVSGRTQTKFEHAIGLYANPIVIPTDQSDNPTFSQYLQRNRQLLASILANQDCPFELLVEQLSRQNEVGKSPLVTTAFLLQTHQRSGLENFDPFTDDAASAKGVNTSMAGSGVEILPVAQINGQFKVELEMFLAGEELMGTLRYDSNLFEPTTIALLNDSYVALLESIVADPNELIRQLAMLGPKSKTILENESLRRSSVPQSLLASFQRHVQERPDSVAIEDGQCSWSYYKLNNQAQRFEAQLQQAEVKRGSVVAVYLPRTKEAIAVMLACWRSGRTTVSLEPSYPAARLRHILLDARPTVIVSARKYEKEVAAALSKAREDCREISTIWIDDTAALNLSGDYAPIESAHSIPQLDPETPAYLVYTSGSTGLPKGVAIPHRGLNNAWSAMSEVIGILPSDRILQTASFSFDASIADIACTLGNGAALVLADTSQLGGLDLWNSLFNTKSTIAIFTPSVLATLPRRCLPDLRCLLVASEECGRDLVDYWSIGRQMYNAYGPSETSVCATMQRCLPDTRKPAIGRPIPNVRIYVMDRLLQPVPVGALGEICIGGESVGLGYLNQPELNRQKFVVDRFSVDKRGRLYRTGDIGRWRADGTLEFHGRRDHQIKLRGMRIELEEIEHVMLSSPGILQIAMVAGPEYNDQIAAFYVEYPTTAVDRQALQETLRAKLPAYMIPRWLIKLNNIPTSQNGKVDGLELNRLWQQHLQQYETAEGSEFVAPRNELEGQIAQAFCDVLQRDHVSITSSLFELGGHSLMAAELACKLQTLVATPIPLCAFLTNPSVAGIASLLSRYHPEQFSSVEIGPKD